MHHSQPSHPYRPPPSNVALTAHRRLLLPAAGLLVLLLALAPLALGRAPSARRTSCKSTARSPRHGARAKHCTPRKTSVKKHTAKKPAHKRVSTPAPGSVSSRVAARCEDGALPAREASGSFGCDDESEPACADGSTPATGAGAAAVPTCVKGTQAPVQEVNDECVSEAPAVQSDQEQEVCLAAEEEE